MAADDGMMTIEELQQLYAKALDYIGDDRPETECHWLYRNQSEEYFENVLHRWKGKMKVHLKDKSGDPRSPINQRLEGVFFLATPQFGSSPFGKYRLKVPADELLSRFPHVYFTDFYCLGSAYHYVTLVATKPFSKSDDLCRRNLLPVCLHNRDQNPFLYYRGGKAYVSNAPLLVVELFFTEDIQVYKEELISAGANILNNNIVFLPDANMSEVATCGAGHTTPGGRPKDHSCSKCNMNPWGSRPVRPRRYWLSLT